jgi:hypothetical protein
VGYLVFCDNDHADGVDGESAGSEDDEMEGSKRRKKRTSECIVA